MVGWIRMKLNGELVNDDMKQIGSFECSQPMINQILKNAYRGIQGARTPLNVSLSKDGKTRYASLILEDSPVSQYSSPSVIQGKDGFVHVVYTWRRQWIKYLKIDLPKITVAEIKDEIWPATKNHVDP
jgi:alpha-L-rhamnosidase